MFETQELRMFISSKEEELVDERLVAKEAVEYFKFVPVMSETRGARNGAIRGTYLNEVRSSNIYIGIFGSKFSEPTKEEFMEARANNIPTLIHVKELQTRDNELKSFLDQIADPLTGITYGRFNNVIELREKIKADLTWLTSKYFLKGVQSRQKIEKKEKTYYTIKTELSPYNIKAGETFVTKASFVGTVKNGFFDNMIIDPDGNKFAWSPDLNTWNAYRDTGTLKIDDATYESEWPTRIPAWAKPDEYTVIVGMYDDPTSTPREGRYLVSSVVKKITVQDTSDKTILLLRKLYKGFLGREPDIGGLKGWYEYIVSAKPRISVVVERGFLYSYEFFIRRIYEGLIGDFLLGEDYERWHTGLTSGTISKVQFVHDILSQREIEDRCDRMSHSEFVSYVNKEFLFNSLPNDEAEKWAEGIKIGLITKEEIVVRCTENDRFFIIEIYKGLLEKTPLVKDLEKWVLEISSGQMKRYEFIEKILKEA